MGGGGGCIREGSGSCKILPLHTCVCGDPRMGETMNKQWVRTSPRNHGSLSVLKPLNVTEHILTNYLDTEDTLYCSTLAEKFEENLSVILG